MWPAYIFTYFQFNFVIPHTELRYYVYAHGPVCSQINPHFPQKKPQCAWLKITEPDMVECNLWGFKLVCSTNQTVLPEYPDCTELILRPICDHRNLGVPWVLFSWHRVHVWQMNDLDIHFSSEASAFRNLRHNIIFHLKICLTIVHCTFLTEKKI